MTIIGITLGLAMVMDVPQRDNSSAKDETIATTANQESVEVGFANLKQPNGAVFAGISEYIQLEDGSYALSKLLKEAGFSDVQEEERPYDTPWLVFSRADGAKVKMILSDEDGVNVVSCIFCASSDWTTSIYQSAHYDNDDPMSGENYFTVRIFTVDYKMSEKLLDVLTSFLVTT